MQLNLETWLVRRRAGGLDAGLDLRVCAVPAYVDRDLRKLWECGPLAHRLAGARSEKCSQGFLW